MAKLDPMTEREADRLDDRPKIQQYTRDLLTRVRQDETDRYAWIEGKVEAYNRRYAASRWDKAQATFPWLNASNVHSGLSDIHCEELKPSFANLMFSGRRSYEMIPLSPEAWDTSAKANLAMDSLLRFRMPDHRMQVLWGIDSLATYGINTDKVYYSYQTITEWETILRSSLPGSIGRISVQEDASPKAVEFLAKMGIVVMTRAQFDAIAPQIKRQVMDDFGLDDEDKADKVSINEIMRFIRNGSEESKLTLKLRRVVEDTPRLVSVPQQNIVCPKGTRMIHEASRICEWIYLTESEIKQRARDGVWDDKAVQAILDVGPQGRAKGEESGQRLAQAQMDRARGNVGDGGEEDLFQIAQLCGYYDIDNDGMDERVSILAEPQTGAICKAIPWDDEWPYTDTFLEATDQDRHSVRGIPEQICDYERHLTGFMRAEHNGLMIETAPMFTYPEASDIDPASVSMMPNLWIPVSENQQVQRIDMGQLKSLALEAPQRAMQQFAERRISGSNRAVLDMPPPERRTAREVQSQESARTRVLTVRAMLFLEGQKRNGKLIWNLWRKYGPRRFWTMVTGQAPQEMTQNQIRGDFMIAPVAAAADMDPDFRANQAMARLQVAMQMQGIFAGSVRHTLDLETAFMDWLNETDMVAARRLVHENTPEQQQAILAQQQQTAQRSKLIADVAERWLMNAPTDAIENKQLLNEIMKQAPHKGLQQVGSFNAAAQATLQRNAVLQQQAQGAA